MGQIGDLFFQSLRLDFQSLRLIFQSLRLKILFYGLVFFSQEAPRPGGRRGRRFFLAAGTGGAALNGLKGLEIKPFSLFSRDFQQETETG